VLSYKSLILQYFAVPPHQFILIDNTHTTHNGEHSLRHTHHIPPYIKTPQVILNEKLIAINKVAVLVAFWCWFFFYEIYWVNIYIIYIMVMILDSYCTPVVTVTICSDYLPVELCCRVVFVIDRSIVEKFPFETLCLYSKISLLFSKMSALSSKNVR